MTYRITEGLPENQLEEWLTNAARSYGTFPDGRVNYKSADIAPIVMCSVVCDNEILLLKRSKKLTDAAGNWSVISGYIDVVRSPELRAQEKVQDEIGLVVELGQISVGKSYTLESDQESRKYIVYPCLVALTERPKVKISNEGNTDYVWATREGVVDYDILADLPCAIDAALATSRVVDQ